MKLLADREVLIRRPKSGTFIGHNLGQRKTATIEYVHVLIADDRGTSDDCRSSILSGLWKALPNASMHVSILPSRRQITFVEQLLETTPANHKVVGVVAVSCLQGVYTLLAERQVPTAVIGSVDHTEDSLASIDCDQRLAGFTLADHMLQQGHQDFLVLTMDSWRPGDHRFYEGVRDSLQAHRLPVGALHMITFPLERRVFFQRVRSHLQTLARPTAVICRNNAVQDLLQELREQHGELPWDRISVATHFDAPRSEVPSDQAYPCTYRCGSTFDMAAQAGEMLAKLSAGEQLPQRHITFPVELLPIARKCT
ncbi:MAG: substrate-binding domain-containing protein [Planctomycetia bacterium]